MKIKYKPLAIVMIMLFFASTIAGVILLDDADNVIRDLKKENQMLNDKITDMIGIVKMNLTEWDLALAHFQDFMDDNPIVVWMILHSGRWN